MADELSNRQLPDLIRDLLDEHAYPHPAQAIELIETHISWVLLAGDFAYKIKKPLNLGFLDFRSLEKRHFFCEEEIRLNRPWAPEIYLGVVKIALRRGQARIGADGDAAEYAVKMRRFDQELRLDRQLANGRLTATDMSELAANIVARHQAAEAVPVDRRQRVLDLTESQMHDNFAALAPAIDRSLLDALQQWTSCELRALRPVIRERFGQGCFRDCHGDLHLANLLRLPDGITSFDCIEFSLDLRQIDVACDVAFLLMDLESKGRPDLAAHFNNRYLELSDDYGSMLVADLYFVYRCLVRAKVAVIRAGERESAAAGNADLAEATRYCRMAAERTKLRQPILLAMHGLSGSGKTWLSEKLLAQLPAVRLRSDRLRKRLAGLGETAHSGSAVGQGIYTASAGDAVYGQMRLRAQPVLEAAHNVILDATFLRREQRRLAQELAADCGAAFLLVHTTAPVADLEQRIRDRADRDADASEADLGVLHHQLGLLEPLSGDEVETAITIDTGDADAVSNLARRIRDLGRAAKRQSQ